MAAFRVASLQKSLDESVPASDLDKANREYTELCEKYRELLDSSNSLVALREETTGYQVRVNPRRMQNIFRKHFQKTFS